MLKEIALSVSHPPQKTAPGGIYEWRSPHWEHHQEHLYTGFTLQHTALFVWCFIHPNEKRTTKIVNKANLRDLIATTGLVILFKLDSNWFFSPCDLEIRWMTSKNYRAPLLHYINLCASSQTPRWIQTGATVRKRSIWVKIGNFSSRVTLKFDGWPWKTLGTSSMVH